MTSGAISQGKGWLDKIADYIVEQGTSGIWTYRKWNSGIAECWGYTSSTLSFTTASGGTYQTPQQPGIAYPSNLFIEEPLVTLQIYGNSNGYLCWESFYKNGSKDATPTWYASRGTTVSNLLFSRIYFSAIGKWK